MSPEEVGKIVDSASPEELDFPAPSSDHADHIVYLTLKGYVKIAADHILHKEMIGNLRDIIGGVIRRLNLIFGRAALEGWRGMDIILCARSYESLLQMALNLAAFERRIIGFPDEEADGALNMIRRALEGWEKTEREGLTEKGFGDAPIARKAVEKILSQMTLVMSRFYRPPGSMVAHMARKIEGKIKDDDVIGSFLEAANREIHGNVYYKMSENGMCRFGNDYALGLRWLRHLGFVQVSTNPVLAAIAYDDDPSLWEGFEGEDLCPDFKSLVEKHREWFDDPELYGDEIAALGTEVSIWPNLAVFRPVAIASGMRHGMVSLQLNPEIADNLEESLRDAIKIYMDASDFLERYDHYLLWGYSGFVKRGRPNIVFKVSGSSPVAIKLTRILESMGIGTNNTVTFTVSQEARLILAKMEGRAEAVRKGIRLTTVYETNMGGRLDDHIREVQAERLLQRALRNVSDGEEALRMLAESLGAWQETELQGTLEEKIRVVCSRKYLRPLNKKQFVKFLAETLSRPEREVSEWLSLMERDIGSCGILVTKRIYEIFFSPENRGRWIKYLMSKYGLSVEQAEDVLGGIDILPASKRKPLETLEALGSLHMTNTEFPNHQLSVLLRSLQADFSLHDYHESVLRRLDPSIEERLREKWTDIRDLFISAIELTPLLMDVIKEAGLNEAERYGVRGLKPEEWGIFGATVKTMTEFSSSYERFRGRCVEFVRKVAGNL